MRRLLPRTFASDESAASAVEFAIVVTPLLLIAFGAIEFGRLMWTRTALQEVAMSTARCMGVKQPACAPSGSYSATTTNAYARAEGTNWSVTIPAASISLDNSTTCSGVSGFSQVSISLTFDTAVPLFIRPLANAPLQAVACFPNQS